MFENGFVNIYTADMPRSLRFYKDVLGFTETFRTPTESPNHVELTLNATAIALSTVEAAKSHQGIDAAPGAPAMCLVLWTTDLDRAYAHLTESGAPTVTTPHDSGNGNRTASLRDPDGNLLDLVTKITS
ncbi:VOC family protein [Kribbella sp. NPDC055110]